MCHEARNCSPKDSTHTHPIERRLPLTPSPPHAAPGALLSPSLSLSIYLSLRRPELRRLATDGQKYILRALQHCQNESTPPDRRGWYYKDDKDSLQGPFEGEVMRGWYDSGHLHGTLQVRCGDRGVFIQLSDLGADAFVAKPDEDFRRVYYSIDEVLRHPGLK